jgi:regulator of nucleoside diphosphate kinase
MTDGSGVVRVGSRVCIRDIDGLATFRIVEHENADATAARVSVRSPLGSALLGHRAGDRVRFRVPDGVLAVTLVDVEPVRMEDAGDWMTIQSGLRRRSEPVELRLTWPDAEYEP